MLPPHRYLLRMPPSAAADVQGGQSCALPPMHSDASAKVCLLCKFGFQTIKCAHDNDDVDGVDDDDDDDDVDDDDEAHPNLAQRLIITCSELTAPCRSNREHMIKCIKSSSRCKFMPGFPAHDRLIANVRGGSLAEKWLLVVEAWTGNLGPI